jgi:hypothetical protein
MTAVLLDYERVVKPCPSLQAQIGPIENFSPSWLAGAVVKLNKNKDLSQAVFCQIIWYNKKRNTCLINCTTYISDVVQACENDLPKNTLLWTTIDSENDPNLKILSLLGFGNPYITAKTPYNGKIDKTICLSRLTSSEKKDNYNDNYNSIVHLLTQPETHCQLSAQFTKKAIKFLQSLPVEKRTHEHTGELFITNVVKKGSEIIYVIDIDEKSIVSGKSETVDVSPTRYNFHTHPKDAYIRHGVEKAWPSSTDYLGYLKLGKNTIFHCVATLEGLYIISFNSQWADKLEKIDPEFIQDNYDINHKNNFTPDQYVDKVNKIIYKNAPIYQVQFLTWQNADKPFLVKFGKLSQTCLVSQNTVKVHQIAHNSLPVQGKKPTLYL